jgi:hypothetical protein
MKSRKLLVAVIACAASLGGCATYGYDDDYYYYDRTAYSGYPAYRYYDYGPRYYYARPPVVSFGLSYSSRGRHWR